MFRSGGWALILVAMALAGAAQADEAPAAARPVALASAQEAEPATLRILNREIITFRASLPSGPPDRRVERARQRFLELPASAVDDPLRTIEFQMEGIRGVQIMRGDFNLFVVVEGDVDLEHGETLEGVTQRTLERLEEVRKAWHKANDLPLLLMGLAKSAAGALVLALLVWALARGTRKAVDWLEAMRDRIAARSPGVDWRELLARLVVATAQLVRWFLLLLGGYFWVRWVLGSFVITEPLAQALDEWFLGQVIWVVRGVLDGLPDLFTVVIVVLLTRAVVDVLGYFFTAVQQGRLRLRFLHPETISATRRIVTILVWGLGIAIAYPYLPGSSTDAFKGLSVLFGVMFTLGSAGLVTQAMGGLVLVYTRALRKGDLIKVNDVTGVVTEVAALAVKVVTLRKEEITIPNAVLVSSPIQNYSKMPGALLTTKVTIGYDTPWRQVHAMLIDAARRTSGLRRDFEPYVYQRALSDFYVEYELFTSVSPGTTRVAVLSELHGAIQDVFNEHGVQIMSPHFEGQPESAVVVPKEEWFKAPAG